MKNPPRPASGELNRIQAICVYSSSSSAVAPKFFDAAEELGALLARRGLALVYGGGNVGLMGALARAVHRHSGRVIGVIPQFMRDQELAYEAADELILTRDLRERKAIMEARADAFLALPGGFGTLEEILEILTLKQLQAHAKPVIFLNTAGFYEPLMGLFEQLYEERFTKPEYRQFYHLASDPHDALAHLAGYHPPASPGKWFVSPAASPAPHGKEAPKM